MRTVSPDRERRLLSFAKGVAIAAIVAASLTNIYELKLVMTSFSAGQDRNMNRYLDRLQQLREIIPRVKTIGYLSDISVADMPANPVQYKRYSLTKYSLVPIVIHDGGADDDYIVGSFSSPAEANKARQQFTVVADFGDDLMLLHKKTP